MPPNTGAETGETPPSPESEPKTYTEEQVAELNTTWEGRTKAAARDALAAVGLAKDDYGNYYNLNPQQEPEEGIPDEELIDDDTRRFVDKTIDERLKTALGGIIPAVDMTVETGLRTTYEDWDEHKDAVKGVLASSGMTLTQAVRTPQLIDTLVNAERGKKLHAKEQERIKNAQAERERQALLSSATGISPPGHVPSVGNLSTEDKEQMAALGITDAETYINLLSEPAQAKIGGT